MLSCVRNEENIMNHMKHQIFSCKHDQPFIIIWTSTVCKWYHNHTSTGYHYIIFPDLSSDVFHILLSSTAHCFCFIYSVILLFLAAPASAILFRASTRGRAQPIEIYTRKRLKNIKAIDKTVWITVRILCFSNMESCFYKNRCVLYICYDIIV